ncbi:hypothetical protein GCM10007881_20210 [Mesorhizobium huakuii]|nr:hypothetical protein GCM10007881_20210 [Mesorhizobium huakuii]
MNQFYEAAEMSEYNGSVMFQKRLDARRAEAVRALYDKEAKRPQSEPKNVSDPSPCQPS